MKSPNKSTGFRRNHMGVNSEQKKYSVETRLTALEDLRNGAPMEEILETHGRNSKRCVELFLLY